MTLFLVSLGWPFAGIWCGLYFHSRRAAEADTHYLRQERRIATAKAWKRDTIEQRARKAW